MGREDASGGGAKSRLPTKEDLKRIALALERTGVEYVLVGGLAVNLHGRPRVTHDIDLLVDSSAENVERIKSALSVLADNAVQEVRTDDLVKYTVVRVADEVVVDLIAKIGDISVKNTGIEVMEVDGVPVKVADIITLVTSSPPLKGWGFPPSGRMEPFRR